MRFIDLTGKNFGRLTVIERAPNKGTQTMWLCKCICGNHCIVRRVSLLRGDTKSCGCLKADIPNHTVHGQTHTKAYNTWCEIKKRCYNKKSKSYSRYGERGIRMAKCWEDNPGAFCDYVSKLSHYEDEGYSLDRIDNNGNYEPGNIRWSTPKEQANNRRSNRLVTYNGENLTIMQLAERYNIKYGKLRNRINGLSWDIERAVNTP